MARNFMSAAILAAATLGGCDCGEVGFQNIDDPPETTEPTETSVATTPEPPTAPRVRISPARPRTDEALQAVLLTPSVDSANRPITYRYAWSRDDAAVDDQTTDRIDPSLTGRGQRWRVTVTALAGDASSEPNTDEVTVINTPPVMTSLTLAPSPAPATEPLTAQAAATDADADPVTFVYAWRLNDAPVADLTGNAVPAARLSAGQQWSVTVTPTDGSESGPPMSVSTRIVGCGDGIVQAPEGCDDANLEQRDHCTNSCTLRCDNLNTGSDANGNAATVGQEDLHWRWSATLGGTSQPATVSGPCSPAWRTAEAGAQWINRAGDCYTLAGSDTVTFYSADFWLSSLDEVPDLAVNALLWADNRVDQVYLNGVETGLTGADPMYGPADAGKPMFAWNISLYRLGLNTVTVKLVNRANAGGANPEGLLLQMPNKFGGGNRCAQ